MSILLLFYPHPTKLPPSYPLSLSLSLSLTLCVCVFLSGCFVASRGKALRGSYNARGVGYRKGEVVSRRRYRPVFPNPVATLKRIPRKYETAPLMALGTFHQTTFIPLLHASFFFFFLTLFSLFSLWFSFRGSSVSDLQRWRHWRTSSLSIKFRVS